MQTGVSVLLYYDKSSLSGSKISTKVEMLELNELKSKYALCI